MQPIPSAHIKAAAPTAAYRRLALAILGLDMPTLTTDLGAQRLGRGRPTPLVAPRPRRAA